MATSPSASGAMPSLAASLLGPFFAYVLLDSVVANMAALCYGLLLALLAFTGLLLWAKLFSVLSRLRGLRQRRQPLAATASAVVAGFLPADGEALLKSAAAFLEVEYPGHLEVVLAFATQSNIPEPFIEAQLTAIAQQMPARFRLFRLVDAADQGACTEAAQGLATGEFLGVFQPGQILAKDCMQQAQMAMSAHQLLAEEAEVAPSGEASLELPPAEGATLTSCGSSCIGSVLGQVGEAFGCNDGMAGLSWSDIAELAASPALSWRQKAEVGCSLTWAKVLPAALVQALPLLAFLCYYKDGRPAGATGSHEQLETLSMGHGLLVPSL